MIKSGLTIQNKYLGGAAYPSDYDPQGRVGSFSVTRPGNVDQFDIGFEKAKTVSPYQERVVEYTTIVPKSVFRPRGVSKSAAPKNTARFGPTAYRAMFGNETGAMNDYMTQRLLGVVNAQPTAPSDSLNVWKSNPAQSAITSLTKPQTPTMFESQPIEIPMIQAPPSIGSLDLSPPEAPTIVIEDVATAEGMVNLNPSTVLNLTDNVIEQETEAGPAFITTTPRMIATMDEPAPMAAPQPPQPSPPRGYKGIDRGVQRGPRR